MEHLVLKANEHGYCEGSQHRLSTRYKSSRFDTSVFFLQTPAARTKWRVTKEVSRGLASHGSGMPRMRFLNDAGGGVWLLVGLVVDGIRPFLLYPAPSPRPVRRCGRPSPHVMKRRPG